MKRNSHRGSHRGSLVRRLLEEKLVEGRLEPGKEIGLKIDQVLTQDATGTMVYLEFETLGIGRVKPQVAVSYVDHNIVQDDFKNADDHSFLQSCAALHVNIDEAKKLTVRREKNEVQYGISGKYFEKSIAA